MLHNVLSRQLPVEPATVTAALETAGIAPDRRPQTVAVGEWLRLLEAFGEIGPDRRGRRRDEAGESDGATGDVPGPGADARADDARADDAGEPRA
jgi:hypothetical protein